MVIPISVLSTGCVTLPKEGTYYLNMPPNATKTSSAEPTVTVAITGISNLNAADSFESPFKHGTVKCDVCGGLGRFKCDLCAGVGSIPSPANMENVNGNLIEFEKRCQRCDGIGSLLHDECKGTGRILVQR